MDAFKALLQPRSVAVIGASSRAGALGHRVVANLHGGGYLGPVLPVHPKHASVLRIHCCRSVAELPFVPDLAILCTPASATIEPFRQLGERGTRAAIVLAFDPDGPSSETPFKNELRAAAHQYGIRWLGPQSAGLQTPRLALNASWMKIMPPPGKLALISQSAAVAASAVSWAAARDIGFSAVVTVGDGADVDVPELMDQLGADGHTQAVLLCLNRISEGRKFIASARSLARHKPVVVLWADTPPVPAPDDRPAVDHNAVCKAAFHRSGLLQVGEIADWFDAVENLGYGRRQIGDRLAVVSNGMDPARLAANFLSGKHTLAALGDAVTGELRALLPKGLAVSNPVNLDVDAGAARFESVLAALSRSQDVDALLVIVTPSLPEAGRDIAQAIAKVARTSGRPVMVCWLGGRIEGGVRSALAEAGVPLFETPERAAQAYLQMIRFRRSQESLRQLPETGGPLSTFARTDLRLSDEAESVDYLRACGLVSTAIFNDEQVIDGDRAAAVLVAVGFEPATANRQPGALLPLRISVGDDPVFGRAVAAAVGSRGWTLLPALNAELSAGAAAGLHAELALLGGPPVPTEAIARALVRISDLLVGFPEIVGVSIPGFTWDDGDLQPCGARLWVHAHERARIHLAIEPYPRQYEERITLRDGRVALVRPLRPDEDGALLEDLLVNVSADDRFLRFCRVIDGTPPDVIARMARVDYDREVVFIALVADPEGKLSALGLVDAFVEPDLSEAEFSVMLRSDLKGTGLGKALMQKIIAYCKGREVRRIFGLVLRQNRGMRGLAGRLGFETIVDPDDDMVEVSLPL